MIEMQSGWAFVGRLSSYLLEQRDRVGNTFPRKVLGAAELAPEVIVTVDPLGELDIFACTDEWEVIDKEMANASAEKPELRARQLVVIPGMGSGPKITTLQQATDVAQTILRPKNNRTWHQEPVRVYM